MNNNQLTEIPMQIGNCERLETLGIRNNHLQALPDSIGQLTRLRWLTFEGNALRKIPVSLQSLKGLVHLNFKSNRLTRIPKCLSKMPKLRFVFLNNNRIDKMIPDQELNELYFVRMLNLSDNPICSLAWVKEHTKVGGTLQVINYLNNYDLKSFI